MKIYLPTGRPSGLRIPLPPSHVHAPPSPGFAAGWRIAARSNTMRNQAYEYLHSKLAAISVRCAALICSPASRIASIESDCNRSGLWSVRQMSGRISNARVSLTPDQVDWIWMSYLLVHRAQIYASSGVSVARYGRSSVVVARSLHPRKALGGTEIYSHGRKCWMLRGGLACSPTRAPRRVVRIAISRQMAGS